LVYTVAGVRDTETVGAEFVTITLAESVAVPPAPSSTVTAHVTVSPATNAPASVLVAPLVLVADTGAPPTVHVKVDERVSPSASADVATQTSVSSGTGTVGVSETETDGAVSPMVTEAAPAAPDPKASDAVTSTRQTSPRVVALAGNVAVVLAAEGAPSTDQA
jgi:hypothetical protein